MDALMDCCKDFLENHEAESCETVLEIHNEVHKECNEQTEEWCDMEKDGQYLCIVGWRIGMVVVIEVYVY